MSNQRSWFARITHRAIQAVKREKLLSVACAIFVLFFPLAVSVLAMSDFAKARDFFAISALALLVILVVLASWLPKVPLRVAGYLGSILTASGFYVWLLYWAQEREAKENHTLAQVPEIVSFFMRCVAYARALPWLWILGGLATGVVVTVFVCSAIRKRRRLIEDAKPKVKILTPINDRNVGWRQTVRGSVSPPDSKVQVLVQYPDGWWHLPSPVDVRGHSWGCRSEFGEIGKNGHAYDVIALLDTSLKAEKYEHLPENEKVARSNVVTVKRNSNEDFIDCPDQPLHQTRIDDKSAIREMVKVCMINCEFHIDAKGAEQKYIDFRFWFLNLSLLPVSIESMKGKITFRHETSADVISLDEAYKLDNEAAIRRQFRSDGCFVVRQFLASHELEPIRSGSAKSVFYLKALHIFITGDGFDPVSLAIPDFIYKGERWKGDGDCDFLFANMAQAEAKIRELKTANESLTSELDRFSHEASNRTEKQD